MSFSSPPVTQVGTIVVVSKNPANFIIIAFISHAVNSNPVVCRPKKIRAAARVDLSCYRVRYKITIYLFSSKQFGLMYLESQLFYSMFIIPIPIPARYVPAKTPFRSEILQRFTDIFSKRMIELVPVCTPFREPSNCTIIIDYFLMAQIIGIL